ncbi:MAG TPA: hypothetical protein VKU01_17440 [Bryobacteraceae bacterium]|nr:hypothetical protein [Bryobacteraceae bacterium]
MKLICIVALTPLAFAQEGRLLERRYKDGETLVYRMKATNEGRNYQAVAKGIVKKTADGAFTEEYAWSNLVFAGAPVNLPPASVDFRQLLSLDPRTPPGVPNLAVVHPMLIGPITDMLTFYADLWLTEKVGNLNKAGDHLYHEHGGPASWADGNYVVLGEDSIDFDITLTSIDGKVATLLVRHVPPKKPRIKIPAPWMSDTVADTPNNWVNVSHNGDKYVAAVGKETFDVEMKISLPDGKILSGTIDNPVIARERDCQDAALVNCGDPRPHKILRQIEINLER